MELSSIMSYCIICVFALLINKVSLQSVNVVEGVTGGSVVLPCATSEIKEELSEINVFWRHNNNLPVYDIIKGTFSLQDQDLTYKNRTESFPTEYDRGNFSLKLNNLTQTDAGNYQCFIQHSFKEVNIQLTINESAVHTGKQPTEENKNPAQEKRLWVIFTPVLGVFMLCLVLCITDIWKKRSTETSRPPPVEYTPCQKNTEVHENGNESKSAKE